ncbi:hypothetical protein U9M48_009587 [Paspalum notatum var. saurae]|uniref:Uncharacterized protein n=1 Tax=Paspalum notatum var. saurae TaxID=547442 RepID=A0AAQ3SRE1_PASNO
MCESSSSMADGTPPPRLTPLLLLRAMPSASPPRGSALWSGGGGGAAGAQRRASIAGRLSSCVAVVHHRDPIHVPLPIDSLLLPFHVHPLLQVDTTVAPIGPQDSYTVPEETQEPKTTVAEPELDEPSVDLHCDEDLNDGNSDELFELLFG